jgi:hypothetical protein
MSPAAISPTNFVNRNKFYQFSTPDYLKIESVNNQNSRQRYKHMDSSPGAKGPPPITVISKTNGWLTVDAETLDRKHAIEKDTKINIRNTSKLAPPWMITDQVRDEKRFRMFKPLPTIGQNVNLEPKRVLLGDA